MSGNQFAQHTIKTLVIISNKIETHEEPVKWAEKIPCRTVKFEAGEENRIVYEHL